ncbi:ligand-binding sensor domain-containing diguanylate cyclase [Frateuria defendens]|uniref:ligand-binding sensor domain-containing diguanylate cyclase n=1 Tax=Frateuria defendens TaxID=2219559 RepID=UPI001293B5BD|nr:diguanylate cyclase [Frateuria defendens]
MIKGTPSRARLLRGLCLVLLACLAHAGRAVEIPLTTYDQAAGLESLAITRMYQDAQGVMWAGTEKGLYRFDGIGFTPEGADGGFQVSEVVGIDGDERGRLWVASRTGLQVGVEGRFHTVLAQGQAVLLDRGQTLAPLPHDRLLLVAGHRLWLLAQDAQGGWRLTPRFDPARLRARPELDQVRAVARLGEDAWFGCGTRLCRLHGDLLEQFGPAQHVPADHWLGFLRTRDGTLWVRGTRSIRVWPAGGKGFVDRDLPYGKGEVAAAGLRLVEDGAGRVLTSTELGVARWDGRRWELFEAAAGLPPVGVSDLLVDRDGSIWLGTYGRGMLHWNGYGLVENWGSAQGLGSPLVWSIARDAAGAVWVTHDHGGDVIGAAGANARRWPVRIAPPYQTRVVLPAADGTVWLALFDGRVLHYRPASGRTETVATLPYFIRAAYFDRAGVLWIMGMGGLYRIDPGARTAVREAPAIIPTGICSDMAEDRDGQLWLACNTGLFRRRDGQWRRMREAPRASVGGYEHVAVRADGGLWLSRMQPGLLRARVEGEEVVLDAADDPLLAQTRFYFLRYDRAGRLWAGGGSGVDVFDGARWVRLSARDGLVWDETDYNAFLADRDGSLWVGTTNGISHVLDPDRLLAPRALRPLLLVARYDGSALAGGSRRPTGAGALQLQLGALGNSAGHPLHFRYRLSGIDADWVQTRLRELRYASLPPGRYRFELEVLDDNRRTLSPPLAFDFTLTPPWWRTPWAYAGAGLLLLAALAGLWRWRHRQLLRRAQRLEQVVVTRTAELEREKRELERVQAQLYHQATHDGLTGLLNRPAALKALQEAIDGQASDSGLALALLDLDHFKAVNDRHGHPAGDAVLCSVAQWLRRHFPPDTLLGRYGGEELLLAIRADSPQAAAACLQQAVDGLAAATHAWQGLELGITCSMGMAWLAPGARRSVEALVETADRRLYQAKQGGRARLVVDPD